MSCKHLVWGCYCKHKQDFCERKLFPRLCEDYCREDEVDDMKKIFNKGPATDTTNNCDAEQVYIDMLTFFVNKMYPNKTFDMFVSTKEQAETFVDNHMRQLGYNRKMIDMAYYATINHFVNSASSTCYANLNNFTNRLLCQPHKDYANYYPTNFRFVLTLILGYLDKLDSIAIIDCDEPKKFFWDKIANIKVPTVCEALNKTRAYVKASNDSNLAEGMRMVEQWFEELTKENMPPKELTIADIEKQLGYKIKIVGDEK